MTKYRKKPVVIEAFQWRADRTRIYPQWFIECVLSGDIKVCKDIEETRYDGSTFPHIEMPKMWLEIKTLEGTVTARVGDYIIQGIQGEIYPCKPYIFEASYELVEGADTAER